MKNIVKKITVIVGLVMFGLFIVQGFGMVAEAQNYQIKEKIPGQNGEAGVGEEGVDTLGEYLTAVYKFGIAIVGILAVVMIGVGGFMYIVSSAGNAGKMADAKGIITNALVGLVMALLSWLILFIINTDLVGNTLGGNVTDLEMRNDWASDGASDAMCNLATDHYERGLCQGNKFCNGNTCVYKDSICITEGTRIHGVCDGRDIANPGDACGPAKGNASELSGHCTTAGILNCASSMIELTVGKQCGDSVCCTHGL